MTKSKKGGNNTQNLRPPQTKEEARERGKQGGIKSGIARREAKTAREILATLNALPVTGNNKDALTLLGIPEDLQDQKALRLVALHKKALTGDAQAQRLLLEIDGENAAQSLNLSGDIGFNSGGLNQTLETLEKLRKGK